MKARRLAPLLAIMAGLLVPAVASAHHLEQDTSKISCILYQGVPRVNVLAHFVDFKPWDMPVHRVTSIDHVNVPSGTGPLSWSGPDHYDRISVPVAPGRHFVSYHASWVDREDHSYNQGGMDKQVVCPAPPPPPPPPAVCAPGTVPTPGMTPPAGCHTPPPPPPPPPGFRTVTRHVSASVRIRNTDPRVEPPAWAREARAGARVTYRCIPGPCPHGTLHTATRVTFYFHAKGVRHVKWYVDGHRVKGSMLRSYRLDGVGGHRLTLWLFDLHVWAPGMGHGNRAWNRLQGVHTVRATGTETRRVRVTRRSSRS